MKKRFVTAVIMACATLLGVMTAANIQMDNNPNKEDMKTATQSAPLTDGVVVELTTTLGNIKVLLYNDTPLHRDNFLKLVKDGAYDGVLFHRVIKDFMIQTGDPQSKDAGPDTRLGAGDPGYTIEAEIDYPRHYHKYGALAAARTGDQVNPERRSSGSQFYIVTGKKYSAQQIEMMQMRRNDEAMQQAFYALARGKSAVIDSLRAAGDKEGLEQLRLQLIEEAGKSVNPQPVPENIKSDYELSGGTPHLDGQYTVFGEVIDGMDVVEKIQNVETGAADRPVEDVRLISARIVEN